MFASLNVRSLASRILIVSPHPDDDILSSSGLIQRAIHVGKSIYVMYLTVGDANTDAVRKYLHKRPTPDAYIQLGYVRSIEAARAEMFLGVPRSHLFFVGFPDDTTISIVTSDSMNRVYQSNYTHLTSARYPFSYRLNASYTKRNGIEIVKSIIDMVRPNTIILNRLDDTNPDHKAARIFTELALREFIIKPKLYSYLIHYPNWPTASGPFLPPQQLRTPNLRKLLLTRNEYERSKEAFRLHRSEYIGSSYYRRFIRNAEYFWEE